MFRALCILRYKGNPQGLFFFLLIALQNNNWQKIAQIIVFLYCLRISGSWPQSQEEDLIIHPQIFKLEVLNKDCIFELCWHHAVVCIAYHKHLSHMYPYIYTKD